MFQLVMHVVAPALFAVTPACASDYATNCHQPADTWRESITYLSRDHMIEHDALVIGPHLGAVNDLGGDNVLVEFH